MDMMILLIRSILIVKEVKVVLLLNLSCGLGLQRNLTELLPCRPSFRLLVLSDVTVCSLASTWVVQTPSWWFDRRPSMCGR